MKADTMTIYIIRQNMYDVLNNNHWIDVYSDIHKKVAIEYLKAYRKSYPKEEIKLIEYTETVIEVEE